MAGVLIRQRPSPSTVQRLARKLKKDMFQSKKYYYNMEAIIELFNQLSGYEEALACNPHQLLWGSCIASMVSVHNIMKQLGVRGTDVQQQVKQGIGAAILQLDENYKVMNEKLIDKILPHENDQTRDDWIQKCVNRRRIFDLFGTAEDFCNDEKTHETPSCVYLLTIIYVLCIQSYLFMFA